MNGVEIHAQLDGRKNDDAACNAWGEFALVAAACSIKGSKQLSMLYCVAGDEKIYGVRDSLEKPLIRNIYFRIRRRIYTS